MYYICTSSVRDSIVHDSSNNQLNIHTSTRLLRLRRDFVPSETSSPKLPIKLRSIERKLCRKILTNFSYRLNTLKGENVWKNTNGNTLILFSVQSL